MKQTVYILIILVLAALLVAGCSHATKCIPVKPTGIIHDQSGNCYVIIENVAYSTANTGEFDCNKIKVGETNWVIFDTFVYGAPIYKICEGKP